MSVVSRVRGPLLVVRLGMFGGFLCLGTHLFLSNPALFLAFILYSLGILLALIDPFYGLGMLLLLLPMHTFMINFLKVFADMSSQTLLLLTTWKEIVLVTVVFIAFVSRERRGGERPTVVVELLAALGLMALGIPFIFISPNIKTGLYGFRNLFEGILIFVAMLRMFLLPERLVRLVRLCMVEAVGISIWGVLQIYFYGSQYLLDFGFLDPQTPFQGSIYKSSGIELQRATSIIAGPNDLGLYLGMLSTFAFILLVSKGALRRTQRKFYYIALVTMLICQFYTFSRTAWVFMAVTVLGVLSDLGRIRQKMGILFSLLLLVGALTSLIPAVKEYMVRTYYVTDPSAAAHYFAYLRALERLVENPLGYGLGVAGYKGGGSIGSVEEIFHNEQESFLMLVALEMGLLGVVAHLGLLALLLRRIRRGLKSLSQGDALPGYTIWYIQATWLTVATILSQILSIRVYELLFQSYFWFFLGAAVSLQQGIQASQVSLSRASSDRIGAGTPT